MTWECLDVTQCTRYSAADARNPLRRHRQEAEVLDVAKMMVSRSSILTTKGYWR